MAERYQRDVLLHQGTMANRTSISLLGATFLALTCSGCGWTSESSVDGGSTREVGGRLDVTAPLDPLEPVLLCQQPLAHAEGSRRFSVVPQPIESNAPIALLLTSPDLPRFCRYVGSDGEVVSSPSFRTPAEWGSPVVSGDAIIPSTKYEIRTVCPNGNTTNPALVTTWRWGDVNNDEIVDVVDINCVLAAFSGNYDNCSLFASDLLGFDPDDLVNLHDILAVIDASQGESYPGPLPGNDYVVPPAPILSAYPDLTAARSIVLNGVAPGAAGVEASISDGLLSATNVGLDGTFSMAVALIPNRLNEIYVTALTACGGRSPSALVQITHDNIAPAIHIDSPANALELTASEVDVVGRVGDMLSGFDCEGTVEDCITVTVNEIPAAVAVGIGGQGTYMARIPLTEGSNPISVRALDPLGNERFASITVTRESISSGVPRMELVSGGGQAGQAHAELTEPLVVRVSRTVKGIEQPFEGKIVTFDVTRSNGRLRGESSAECSGVGTMLLQCHADSEGMVRAYWRLGDDAGAGNNRVVISSRDVEGTVYVSASATPATARQINVGFGNNQFAEVGSPAPQLLRAWVSDACNGVSGEPVTFSVIRGGGFVNGMRTATVITGPTGHAEVEFVLGPHPGNNVVQATFPGNSTLAAEFNVVGVKRIPGNSTTFSGLVFDNANQPLENVRVTLTLGGNQQFSGYTNPSGHFVLDLGGEPQSAVAQMVVDGATAVAVGGRPIPEGFRYPYLHYTPIIIPNAENKLPSPILLPVIDACNDVVYDGVHAVTLTVRMRNPDPEAQEQCIPAVDGLQMTIQADTIVTLRDGTTVGPNNPGQAVFSLNQVQYEDIPMPLPDGASPLFAWTLQPAQTKFSKPVKIEFPNVAGLPPGAISNFLSFNHDTERFEVVATGSVSDDGSLIVSDADSGITVSGWGSNCPPYSVTGSCEREPNDLKECPSQRTPPGAPTCEWSPSEIAANDGIEGNGVYTFSGEFFHEVEDLRIKGRGMDFVWSRKYASRRDIQSPLGRGWDFSYNILLDENLGPDGAPRLHLCDGNTRVDLYRPETGQSNAWTRPGFFRELRKEKGLYVLEFADTGRWEFDAFKRISAIVDRNDNRIAFTYNSSGQLVVITDTLGREIEVGYNGDGFISNLTDFDGRVVHYEYYLDGEQNGAHGDLKAVRTPVVVGTPNGNDFVNGKTVVYQYSDGFDSGDEVADRLNHNLITITDAKGQIYLRNQYSSTLDSTDIYFDRVVTQRWGTIDESISFAYDRLLPGVGPPHSVIRTRVSDRNGNSKHLYFDSGNRCLSERTFSDGSNPADPPYWETNYTWNNDSLLTRVQYPNGNELHHVFRSSINPNIPAQKRSDLLQRIRLPGAIASDQPLLREQFSYDDRFGCSCGFTFVTRYTDARDHITEHVYDENGNRTKTTHRIPEIVEEWNYNDYGQVTEHILPADSLGERRRDESVYYGPGSTSQGYLHKEIVDADGFALTTTYTYDDRGNIIEKTDPRQNSTDYHVNALDQIVREESRPVGLPGQESVRYITDNFYDANNNVMRVERSNIDEEGNPRPNNPKWVTETDYEILNNPVERREEVSGAHVSTTQFEYDGNRNQTHVIQGEAANGNQTANFTHTYYDERDLPHIVVAAEHDGDQSTTRREYDKNGNLVRELQGTEDKPRITERRYDGYNRLIAQTDAMGNIATFHFDENGNKLTERISGELVDEVGESTNVLLAETTREFDSMDRETSSCKLFFDTETGESIGDGSSCTNTTYDPASQVIEVTNDREHSVHTTYDSAHRKRKVTDPYDNTIVYTYDANSNVVAITETEKSYLDTEPDEVFTTTFQFDGLDRQVSQTDNVGNETKSRFDSRNNLGKTTDARGNVTRFEYDGLNRKLRARRIMTEDGTGNSPQIEEPEGAGVIETSQEWDDSSRLTAQIDDSGHRTEYEYDALNRRVVERYADGTQTIFTYDVHGNRIRTIDANGTEVRADFDRLNRLVGKEVETFGNGVSEDTTFELYQYDGLSRMVRAEDDDAVVLRKYNSLSNITEEALNGQTTTSTYDSVGNMTHCLYPGGREINFIYDDLERLDRIEELGEIVADYDYIGPSRVRMRTFGNESVTTYDYDGIDNTDFDFGVRKLKRTHHRLGSVTIDEHAYTWDRAQNKKERDDLRNFGPPRLTYDYTYDSANRLVMSSKRFGLNPPDEITYQLDGVGNRMVVDGDANEGDYELSCQTPMPADCQVNQYTETPFDERTYDENGNLIAIESSETGSKSVAYDYRNQLVQLSMGEGEPVASYRYDALGRRIEKSVTEIDSTNITRFFFSDLREIEEQSDRSDTIATYVYGRYIDEVLSMARDVDGNGSAETYYLHCDDMYNVMAVTNATGVVIERYDYTDYGAPSFFDPADDSLEGSLVQNPFLFVGRRLDQETGFYHFRTRFMDPQVGRFVSRDTKGIWSDERALGNGLSYAANNPFTLLDPLGLAADDQETTQDSPNTGPQPVLLDLSKTLVDPAQYQVDPPPAEPQFTFAPPSPAMFLPDAPSIQDVQTALDVAGFTPIGPLADIPNAIISATQGDLLGAGTNLLASVYGLGDAAKAAKMGTEFVDESIYVIGRRVDTAVAKDWPGHSLLDIANWTVAKNDAWVQSIIEKRGKVYLATPQTKSNLWDPVNNRGTVFSRELEQFQNAGYSQIGDYLHPPSK